MAREEIASTATGVGEGTPRSLEEICDLRRRHRGWGQGRGRSDWRRHRPARDVAQLRTEFGEHGRVVPVLATHRNRSVKHSIFKLDVLDTHIGRARPLTVMVA